MSSLPITRYSDADAVEVGTKANIIYPDSIGDVMDMVHDIGHRSIVAASEENRVKGYHDDSPVDLQFIQHIVGHIPDART